MGHFQARNRLRGKRGRWRRREGRGRVGWVLRGEKAQRTPDYRILKTDLGDVHFGETACVDADQVGLGGAASIYEVEAIEAGDAGVGKSAGAGGGKLTASPSGRG